MMKAFLLTSLACCLALPASVLAETPVRRSQTAMKPVICRVVEEARGKRAEELASALEADGARLAQSNYELAAVIPGDPPIACYRGRGDPSKLPRGAR
jgi:hypothetical protein